MPRYLAIYLVKITSFLKWNVRKINEIHQKVWFFFSFLLRHTMNRRKGGTYLKLTLQWLARDDRKLNQKKLLEHLKQKQMEKKVINCI